MSSSGTSACTGPERTQPCATSQPSAATWACCSMVSMPLATSPPVLLDGATASPPTDNYTTALAALIAGSSDHDFGGAAPGSPLLAISVLDENLNATNAAIAAGVDRAALGGARVTCLAHGSMERSEVIDDALGCGGSGVVVVAPVGNGGDVQPEYPAASAGVLSVGAVDRRRRLTPWTDRGPWVHVMEPGDEMFLPAGEEGYAPSQGHLTVVRQRHCRAAPAGPSTADARPDLRPASRHRTARLWAERWCGRHDHRCLCRRPPCHGRAGIPMSREQLGRPVK
jgi:hypothetical protein